jgi:hypothetical protein
MTAIWEPGFIRCANCGRKPRPDENPDDEWRAYSDGVGELHTPASTAPDFGFG